MANLSSTFSRKSSKPFFWCGRCEAKFFTHLSFGLLISGGSYGAWLGPHVPATNSALLMELSDVLIPFVSFDSILNILQ
jgi:hypothetical protein